MVKLAALLNANSSNYSPRLLGRVAEAVKRVNKKEETDGLCRPTYDNFSLSRDLGEIAEKRPEYLLLGGGDGSVLVYLSRLNELYKDEEWPKIIYLQTGRENRLGHELGYKTKPTKFLEEVVQGIKEEKTREERMSLIEAKIDEGIEERKKSLLTFDLGFGIATNLLLHYYGINPERVRRDDDFRNIAYPKREIDALKTFLEASLRAFGYWTKAGKKYFGETRVSIRTEEEDYGEREWLGGFIATNRHVWKGFKAMYKGREDPERMHLIAMARPPLVLVLKLPILYRGGYLGRGSLDETVKEVELGFERPTIIQAAGEFYVAEKVELRVAKKISFVLPRGEE